ncbi:enoyl-CoA hydratase-related protein [Solirubrobacter ginsenosidimutans]|uniref:Enoyl-CoA hydratase-related protein n=1 Tax=Solirubrobacter ginsenosidimutans TaxID=490573 RepID=A0A9X3MMT4_9ACTN|nr:enoyl-CoA hydratase-related protein [Solirubrobacter ginsenosidimutans]MDA0159379.1 enoyl-CoA hydratase-related protein [Solirubrobacter ginsenosidimutans]
MKESVTLEVRDRVAYLTLNRPEAGNALNPAVIHAFRDAAESLDERDDVGAVLFTGAGKNFSVGGDLQFMHDAGDDVADAVYGLATTMHAGILALAELDAPVISVVRGAAAGGGMSLAIAADLVLAAETAHFTVAYTAIGFSMDGGASWTLPRIVGHRKATELALLNERLSSARAAELGLVTRVLADDALEAEADALAQRLANGPIGAHGAIKRLLRFSSTSPFGQQLEDEARTIAGLSAAPDGREGVLAFLDKRAPHFGEP